jgi:hypothetical protein
MATVTELLQSADENIANAQEALTFLRLSVLNGRALPGERVQECRARLSDASACFELAMKRAAIKPAKGAQR